MEGFDKLKRYLKWLFGPFMGLVIVALIIIFVIIPFGWPCSYKPFDWYDRCPIETSSPNCTLQQQLSEDGKKCIPIQQIVCRENQELVNNVCVCKPTYVLENGICRLIKPVDLPSIPNTTTNPIQNNATLPTSTSSEPAPSSDALDVVNTTNQPQPDPQPSPAVSNPTVPIQQPSPIVSSPTVPIQQPSTSQTINVVSTLIPDVSVKVIHNYNYASQVVGYQYLESIIKNLDHISEVTIIPKKNTAYKGISKMVVTHSTVDTGVILNAIGRTPSAAPASLEDDLRPMSYYVWGVGKHKFSVIDNNSVMKYRSDIVLSFN